MTRLFLRWWLLWLAMAVLLSAGCARSKCQTCPGLTLEFQDPNLDPPKNVQDIFQVTLQSIEFDWLIYESELIKQDKEYCYKLAKEKDNAQVCIPNGWSKPINASGTKAFRVSRMVVRFTLSKQESQNVRNSQNISVELLGRASKTLQVFDPDKETAVTRPREELKFSLSGKWLVVQKNKESCIAQFTSSSLASQEHTFDSSTVKITWTKGCP